MNYDKYKLQHKLNPFAETFCPINYVNNSCQVAVSLDEVFNVKIDDNPYTVTWLENTASRSSVRSKYIGGPIYRPAMLDELSDSEWLNGSSNNQNVLSKQSFQCNYLCKTFIEEQLTDYTKNSCSRIQQSIHTLESSRSSQVNSPDEVGTDLQIDNSQFNDKVNTCHDLERLSIIKDGIMCDKGPYMVNCIANISDSMGFLQFNEQMHNCRVTEEDTSDVNSIRQYNCKCYVKECIQPEIV